MPSKLVLALAAFVVLTLAVLDISYHGHFSDLYYRRQSEKALVKARYSVPDQIQVTAADRWVVLDGEVPTKDDRIRAANAVFEQVDGIRGLTNNLRSMEAICAQSVLDALKGLAAAGSAESQISYLVDEGCNITLTGWVPTDVMKEGIEKLAASVPGVQGVTNNIEVGYPKKKIQDILIEILRVQNIHFDHNKWIIRRESLVSMDKIAEVLKKYPDIRVKIEGHTDSVDTVQYNQWLSEQRAKSVRDALIQRGIAKDRLEAVGFGETRPITSNETPEGRAENRRIEFKVL